MKNLIVVPAYNEAKNLPAVIPTLAALPGEFETLVVNDGSTDETSSVAHALSREHSGRVHVVDLPLNSGIGATVQTGCLFARSRGDFRYVVQFDGDGQHDPGAILALVEACETDNLDLCVGSRFLANHQSGFRSTRLRRIGIRFFTRLLSTLAGKRVTDATSGFRCAGPRAWNAFARHYPDDYPEPESLFWCLRQGLRVGEIPVRMFARKAGTSSIRCWHGAYYMTKVTLAILFDRIRRREALKA